MSELQHSAETSTLSPASPENAQPSVTARTSTAPYGSPASSFKTMQPYVVGGVIVALVLFLGYQQIQINRLTSDLSLVSDNVKSSDVKTRLESQEHSLGEMNSRLAYLDSKINATDQKAQEALNRIKAHEDNDVIGNMMKSIKQALNIK